MRFAEFFAGIGLVRLGLERAGWHCAFANDIDEKKREMYRAQFPDDPEGHFICDDVRNVKEHQLPRVDLATASFPCTDLSLAGGRAGLAGEHSSALWPFLEVLEKVKTMRPALVMLENVPGFLTSHNGADLKSALMALRRIGYAVDAFIIDAAAFVPQSRQRLFIVGRLTPGLATAERRNLFGVPISEHRLSALVEFIVANPEVAWELRDLPDLPRRTTSLPDILEQLPDSASEWWSPERAKYLLDQMSDRHRQLADAMISGQEETVGTVFRRVRNGKSMAELRTDGIAGCLRTPKGGSGRQILFVAGKGQYRARLLTPRECARLMGADDFPLHVPLNQALFGFGDAVCVPVITWIAENYLNPVFAEIRERSVVTA